MPPSTRSTRQNSVAPEEIPKKINDALVGIASMLEKLSDKIDDLGDRVSVIEGEEEEENPGGPSQSKKRRRKDLEAIDEEEEGANPIRGLYGKCGPIESRFEYLDAKVRDAALAFLLPPESLPLLLPPTSGFARPPPEDVLSFGFIAGADGLPILAAAPSTKLRGDMVSKFMTGILNPATFLFAWSIFVELAVHGLGSPEESREAVSALMWYARWVAEKSVTHTWESICRYHLRVCGKRCASEFHVKSWFENVDSDAVTDLRLLPEPAARSAPGAGGRTEPKKRRTLA